MPAADRALQAAIAVTRFGLGARPGEIAQTAHDPQAWLMGQVRPGGAPTIEGVPSATARLAELRDYRAERQEARQEKAADQPALQPAAASTPPGADADKPRDPAAFVRRLLREETGGDFLARTRLGATTPDGFAERWALFWANHFTVSATKLATATVVGPFETEAIRPHVFGRFADLLAAAETHPAMLLYLDQAQSVGPGSPLARRVAMNPQARRRAVGLNENLAREILELHTVGVNGGYTQADVTEFARAMTGISLPGPREAAATADEPVIFRALAHEPGPRTILGVRYAEDGRAQAQAVLRDLAAKPATARFICGKIARHFVADAPPPALTGRLEGAWMRSGGDLSRVAEALVTAPEAWNLQPAKFKTPYEYIVSCYRTVGAQPTALEKLVPILTALGQRPFAAPSPKGWPEEAEAWAAPDAIVKRMQYAQAFAAIASHDRDPSQFATSALGERLTPATATAVARAESRPEGLALLLMSPEFQRR
jgi:uncharacterized protein (DUF1800 family)